jgi:hypothetical protein
MAYSLKKISYLDRSCHILLQNDNGPCPLIAAANALLLRGAVSLRPAIMRANVISTDDLVHLLADWALHRTSAQEICTSLGDATKAGGEGGLAGAKRTGIDDDKHAREGENVIKDDPTQLDLRQQQQQYAVSELMEILPKLQYGLDVNPKFTNGPDGCEYTNALSTFDVLGIDLVHGWLLDPSPSDDGRYNYNHNQEAHGILRNKSYNQLIDLVIQGNDAQDEMTRLQTELTALQLNEKLSIIPETKMKLEGHPLPSETDGYSLNATEEPASSSKLDNTISPCDLQEMPNVEATQCSEHLSRENKEGPRPKEETKTSATESLSQDSTADFPEPEASAEANDTLGNLLKDDSVHAPEEAQSNCRATQEGEVGSSDRSETPAATTEAGLKATATSDALQLQEDWVEVEVVAAEDKKLPLVGGVNEQDQSPVSPVALTSDNTHVNEESTDESKESDKDNSQTMACIDNTVDERNDAEKLNSVVKQIAALEQKLQDANERVSAGHIISSFLNDTGHQLTHYGLVQLRQYIQDGTLAVFFRNNHFSTITKHAGDGQLYLLVTDLGYSNVEEVVWEKLDSIDGDTDYANHLFQKPPPRTLLAPTAPALNPERFLGQAGQHEMDYQLAVRLSEGRAIEDSALDEEEAQLIAAATAASLNEYTPSPSVLDSASSGMSSIEAAVARPSEGKTAQIPNEGGSGTGASTSSANAAVKQNLNHQDQRQHEHDPDLQLAIQLQAELNGENEQGRRPPTQQQQHGHYVSPSDDEASSLALAQQLQAEENVRARPRQTQQQGRQPQRRRPQQTETSKDPGCIIS